MFSQEQETLLQKLHNQIDDYDFSAAEETLKRLEKTLGLWGRSQARFEGRAVRLQRHCTSCMTYRLNHVKMQAFCRGARLTVIPASEPESKESLPR